jgi:hypothetical protein
MTQIHLLLKVFKNIEHQSFKKNLVFVQVGGVHLCYVT